MAVAVASASAAAAGVAAAAEAAAASPSGATPLLGAPPRGCEEAGGTSFAVAVTSVRSSGRRRGGDTAARVGGAAAPPPGAPQPSGLMAGPGGKGADSKGVRTPWWRGGETRTRCDNGGGVGVRRAGGPRRPTGEVTGCGTCRGPRSRAAAAVKQPSARPTAARSSGPLMSSLSCGPLAIAHSRPQLHTSPCHRQGRIVAYEGGGTTPP